MELEPPDKPKLPKPPSKESNYEEFIDKVYFYDDMHRYSVDEVKYVADVEDEKSEVIGNAFKSFFNDYKLHISSGVVLSSSKDASALFVNKDEGYLVFKNWYILKKTRF